ncbi:phospholipid-transporting ATPase ID isoform X2 [Lampris incognitus]|uniref:phospholipid-transporting ATPase ID isoform X2 n=1 Tax=Lampris incognitus TaxID=2546036 RepID=UPI0024B4F63A|nr:phospholipid-transporting ATPase ID isoform X2 [Lampris incognitus]
MSFFSLDFSRKKEREVERKLRANDREYNLSFKYATNAIKTSKYNLFTFLPLNLFEQFQRIANAYFLFLLVLQVIPQISSLSWFTTVVPLVLVLSVTAAKDAIDDINRHRSDNQVNNRRVQVLIDGELRGERWMDVQVGDIIKLENNQFVTADLLLLSSSEPLNLVYIETAELDGETNLKVRQALTVTGDLGDNIDRLAAFNGEVHCEPPNNRLDRFMGTLTCAGQKYSLDNEKILLRGCTLRNTEWCFGLVLFGGPQTKLMQNCGKTTFKRTSIDRLMNVLVLCIFGFLACMCTILAVGNGIWEVNEGSQFTVFLPRQEGGNAAFCAFLTFWSYVIILNTVVPISLYVSVEIIRLGNSFYIDWDRKMYHAHSDTPAEARTTTLNEELGQIKYVFSDKTGTLTQNIMTFNKCTINGKSYGDVYDYSGQRLEITEDTETVDFSFNPLADPKFLFHDHALVEAVKLENQEVHAFFRLLALCHTVMAEEKNEETAENIGYSCNMLREEMREVFVISGTSPTDVRQELRNALTTMKPDTAEDTHFLQERTLGKGMKAIRDEVVNGEYGLVINGHSLAYALECSMELDFLRTACMCKAVICCRVTPLQKAQVVELVKKYRQAVTLAIGDGANDVSMIKAAHIGVGISGQEGMQAVLSSDFSFAQFRFLQRLLLVHGRWSYLRMCKFLRYFFYKNFTFTFVHFWYAFFCGFSAQTVYDEWFITLYNLVYTALPVLGMSLFDQDVNELWSFQHPELYVPGQLNLYFSKTAFFKCALHSCYSSLVLFFIPYAAMYDTVRDDGKDIADYQSFALLTQTCLLIAVCIQMGLEMAYWTAVNTFFVLGSLAMYFAVTFTMYSNGIFLMLPSSFPFIGTARNTLNQPNVWLTILLTSILCILPVIAYRFLWIQLRPTINDKVMFKVRQAKATPPPPPRRTRMRRTSSRRSGYAFSHAQGYGDLVTSRRFLRRPAISRSSGLTPKGRTTTGFSPMGRSAGYSPTGRPQNTKVPEVEVTSLQMYRTVRDPVF